MAQKAGNGSSSFSCHPFSCLPHFPVISVSFEKREGACAVEDLAVARAPGFGLRGQYLVLKFKVWFIRLQCCAPGNGSTRIVR